MNAVIHLLQNFHKLAFLFYPKNVKKRNHDNLHNWHNAITILRTDYF